MTGQYIVQGIFALAGITSLLASLLNWNWFFTTRNAQTIVRNVGRGRARLFYGRQFYNKLFFKEMRLLSSRFLLFL